MNAVDDGMIEMIDASCDIVEKDFVGMVVGNHAANFSAGANIFKVLLAAQKGDWDIVEEMVIRLPECQHEDEVPLQAGGHGSGGNGPGRRLRNSHARGASASRAVKPTWVLSKSVSASFPPAAAARNPWFG